MVYVMKIYVDGGCRGNGKPWAIGAAGAVVTTRSGAVSSYSGGCLPYDPRPSNQRAEIQAIIYALEKAIAIDRTLRTNPWLEVKIYSDSQYAVSCMNKWIYKWRRNGWINAAGNPVANQDLIREADRLDDDVRELGSVEYHWISREENHEADAYVNEIMDDHERDLCDC
ncbi:hypothetical protein V491_04607 [Pseudogymnoascus sp. VKM F-3775]|nr:hypothetical protein V491_04607 [Pseudogymnoascus sp. VKM F-3775]